MEFGHAQISPLGYADPVKREEEEQLLKYLSEQLYVPFSD
jgi:hypothetical protein